MPFPLFVFLSAAIAGGTVASTWLLSSLRRPAIAIGVIGATALLLFHGPGYFNCFADDAYITFRYSDHLAEGVGPNWNSTGHVEGYTNFSWMLILAGFSKAGADLVVVSQVLGLLALLATFFFVYRTWRMWADEEAGSGLDRPVVVVAAFVGLALTDGANFWGFSGLETPLFMALLTGGAYVYLREQRNAAFPWSAVILFAAALTRPEGLIAAAVTGLFTLSGVVRAEDKRAALVRTVIWGGLFLLLYGSYFLWRYTYYDSLLPNSFYAKAGVSLALFERGLTYIWFYGLRYQLLALVVGTALLLSRPRLQHDGLYLLTLTGAMFAGIVVEGGDAFGHGRFIMPLLPLLYLAGLCGFATLLRQVAQEPPRAAFLAAGALVLGALALYPAQRDEIICRQVHDLEQRQVLGEWLTEHTPAHYTIAAYAVGALGYYTDRDVLDLLGINDVVIAHTRVPGLGTGIGGHERYNIDYVLDVVRPEIIVPSDAEGGPIAEEELRRRFSIPSPVRARDALLTDPRLWERYDVRSLLVKGWWFNFFQRADLVGELQAPGLR